MPILLLSLILSKFGNKSKGKDEKKIVVRYAAIIQQSKYDPRLCSVRREQ